MRFEKFEKMSETNEKVTVKLPTFNGKKEKFELWWWRFKAYTAVAKFGDSIKEKFDRDMPLDFETLDKDPVVAERQEKALHRNALAVADYTMAFDNEDLMALIDAGTNSDWPDGHAGMITWALLKKFKPDDIMSKAEMKKDIRNIKMKEGEDPVTIFNQILAIELH